jgi:hypothetical protein
MTTASGAQPDFQAEKFSRYSLLTGAGFSRNWGGYLASEIRELLISRAAVREYDPLRRLLLREPNYETALQQMGTIDPKGYGVLERAIEDVFSHQDDAIRNFETDDSRVFHHFLRRFGADGKAILFTTNQDLLMERRWLPDSKLNLPGVRLVNGPFPRNDNFGRGAAAVQRIPEKITPVFDDDWNLIKLHGSFDWRRGDRSMAITGESKMSAITNDALLSAYFEVFRRYCHSGGVRLMVAGYRFGDSHINQVIATGVEEYDLRLFIWDTLPSLQQQDRFKEASLAPIWDGLI